jgi:hypothetical protein
MAIASFILGSVSLGAWINPMAGIAVSTAGLVLGVLGKGTPHEAFALAGVIMSIIGLITSIAHAAARARLRDRKNFSPDQQQEPADAATIERDVPPIAVNQKEILERLLRELEQK